MIFDTFQAGVQSCAALVGCVVQILTGNFVGTADVAPEYLHIDVLESRKTTKQIDMTAFRMEANLICNNGWCLKPSYTYGSKKGIYSRGGLGVGICTPLSRVVLTPTAGFYYTQLETKIDTPDDDEELITQILDLDEDVNERYRAGSLYVGVDVMLIITPSLRITGTYQYAWSHSHIKLKDLWKKKGDTAGQLYSGVIHYALFGKLGLHAGFEYNQTLAREKNGLRTRSAYGGITYFF